MIISRTSQYAVQALIYIATQETGKLVLNREIAERLNVPAPYLAKIMQQLCRGGVLDSFRGRSGGFCLKTDASQINLMQILLETEGHEFTKGCVLGLKRCSDETACPMHSRWMPIKQHILDLLQDQTLDKLAHAVINGKYRISDISLYLTDSLELSPA